MHTTFGTWSVRLAATFIGLFASWLLYVRARPIPRPTFFSDPIHVVLIFAAVAAALAGGTSGIVALLKRDRSVGIVLAVLLGAFVLWWTVGEIHGH